MWRLISFIDDDFGPPWRLLEAKRHRASSHFGTLTQSSVPQCQSVRSLYGVWPLTASMEVKNKHAYVITQDICNKFIEVIIFVGCMVCVMVYVIPMMITCILQGTLCDPGIPRTFYGGKICSVLLIEMAGDLLTNGQNPPPPLKCFLVNKDSRQYIFLFSFIFSGLWPKLPMWR